MQTARAIKCAWLCTMHNQLKWTYLSQSDFLVGWEINLFLRAIAEKPHSCFTGEHTKMVDITFSTVLGTGTLECNLSDQILVLALDNVEDCWEHVGTDIVKIYVRVATDNTNFVTLFAREQCNFENIFILKLLVASVVDEWWVCQRMVLQCM